MALCSRRQVLRTAVQVGGALVVAGYLAPHQIAFASERTAAEPATTPKIPLIAVLSLDDPASAELLEQHFPGFSQLPAFRRYSAMAYLITNHGTASARAVTSVWTQTGTDGFTKAVFHYFRPRAERKPKQHFGLKGNKTRFTAKVALLKPGETKLLTPYFCWSSSYYKKSGQAALLKLLLSSYKTTFPVQPSALPLALPCTLSIDAVAGIGCRIYGADKHGLGKMLRTTRNAEHDEAISVIKLQQAGAATEDIKKMLQSHASGLAFDITPKHDLYYRVRQRQAKILLRRFAKARPDQFSKTLTYLGKRKKTLNRHVA